MGKPRMIGTAVAALLLVVVCGDFRSSSTLSPAPAVWVVEGGPTYTGPRGGGGEHFVTCVPQADLRLDRADRYRWREVTIPPGKAYTGEYDTGVSCPAGPVRMFSDPGEGR